MGSSSRGLSGLAGGTTASRGGFGGTTGSSFGGGLPLAHAAQRTSRPGDSFGGGGNASIGSGRRVSSGAGSSRGGGALGDEPSAAHLFAICISPQEPIDSVRAACASLLLLASRDDGRSVATDGGTKTLFTILSIFRCVSLPLFLLFLLLSIHLTQLTPLPSPPPAPTSPALSPSSRQSNAFYPPTRRHA